MFYKLSLILLGIFCSFFCSAQCTFNGTNGGQPYSVMLEINPVSISLTGNQCATNGGFNYKVNLDYTITVTGNPPANLYNFQGSIACSNSGQTSTFELPKSLVSSTGTTVAANAYAGQVFCPAETATPMTLGCNTVSINISGPGLNYSNFSCPIGAGLVPVTLIDHNISKEESHVIIDWSVTDVYNHEYYQIFHSIGGRQWHALDQLYTQEEEITHIHESPQSGINYYKVIQYDLDGTSSELFIESMFIEGGNERNRLVIYPNPVSEDFVYIDFNNSTEEVNNDLVFIWDAYGKLIETQSIITDNSTSTISLDKVPNGIYFIGFSHHQSRYKLIINK